MGLYYRSGTVLSTAKWMGPTRPVMFHTTGAGDCLLRVCASGRPGSVRFPSNKVGLNRTVNGRTHFGSFPSFVFPKREMPRAKNAQCYISMYLKFSRRGGLPHFSN